MKYSVKFIMILLAMVFCPIWAGASDYGIPIKYISSCEIDFNEDDESDIALLVETFSRGRELIVLISNNDGYKTYSYVLGESNMYLLCIFGNSLKETDSGSGEKSGQVYHTNGSYLVLEEPEGSSKAYFWFEDSFKEIWISD